ncbi:MAG: precorrin-6y C5,15-methyltransferase (decarboxylating) subunit CbiE, partial [Rhodospirillaceae bacterium]|nr:precorrin-6y C5,15-methyltransferase (decarboxylating) subunit CbiE [Rhodospirillaceae bacterium]
MTDMHEEKQWLSVIGIGEEGLNELSAPARKLISSAEFIIGGHRQLAMIPNSTQEKIPWPSPISSLVEKLEKFRGRQTCVLATGDPLSFGIGSTLSRIFSMAEMQIIPSLSASTLICARKGWPHNDADFISLHGRPISTLETFLRPKGKLIILSNDGQTPSIVAEFLTTRGYGASDITVFEHMNGTKERCFAGEASSWKHEPGVAFNTIAVDLQCTDIKALKTRAPGLPDNAFIHDGQITKREVRAATLSILEPFPGALLWDIGAGSGSIGIEWMRTDHRCQA